LFSAAIVCGSANITQQAGMRSAYGTAFKICGIPKYLAVIPLFWGRRYGARASWERVIFGFFGFEATPLLGVWRKQHRRLWRGHLAVIPWIAGVQ
jgi:hypothetical protein